MRCILTCYDSLSLLPGVDWTQEAKGSSLASGESEACCMLPQLWQWPAITAHDWWGWEEWQHTEGCLALWCQLREVEGGEGGVGVYGNTWDLLAWTHKMYNVLCRVTKLYCSKSTLLWPHSEAILTASFDCLECSKTCGRCVDGAERNHIPLCSCIHLFQTS